MNAFALITFILFTIMVGVISYLKTKDEQLDSSTGYFLAGRSLPWYVIAGSLFLTNISAEQMTGLNGNAFLAGASVMAWETVASLAMIAMALFFLPKFLKSGITTVPQFLEQRFGQGMRRVASFIYIYALIIGFLPFVLYAGAITLGKLFDLSLVFGSNEELTLWIIIAMLGLIGGCYAVFGGLKAVAVSDTINGVGLIIGGFIIPILALYRLGDQEVMEGVQILLRDAPERLQALGDGQGKSIPWQTLFTGVLIINLFYWCTNQAIVQRAFGAKDLAEAQKGILFAAFLKVLGVAMLVLPGIIAWHMHQRGIITVPFKGDPSEGVLASDMAYPLLIKAVLPSWMTGFFGAVMFGAVLSSFNSGLNSLSTLFSIDIYKEMIHNEANDQQIVKAGKIFGTITIVVCIMIAPLIGKADGLYTLMRTIMAVINVPIFAVLLMGILSKRAPALAAYIMLPIGMAFFYIAHFIMGDDFGFIKIHWLHTAGFNLVIICTGMYIISKIKPQATAFQPQDTGEVDTTSWSLAALSSWVIFGLLALLYVVLSPWGLLA